MFILLLEKLKSYMKNINFEEIAQKEKLLSSIISQLKTEFIGIDEQIDNIMDTMRSWYLFSDMQERPIILNLWGMSGCGKTSLVKRIVELLGKKKDMLYFNFSSVDDMNKYDIERILDGTTKFCNGSKILVYDEFQYAAIKDKHGNEKSQKAIMKAFWELLDSGKVDLSPSYYTLIGLKNIKKYIDVIISVINEDEKRIPYTDINIKKIIKGNNHIDFASFVQYFALQNETETDCDSYNCSSQSGMRKTVSKDMCEHPYDDTYNPFNEKPFSLQKNWLCDICEIYGKMHNIDENEFYIMIQDASIMELRDIVSECVETPNNGFEIDFSKSIIFVIGNLDEAYDLSFDVNPDMSPDQFNALTKKMTIVEIKEALQKRFRNEQIARLGNNHVLYPSFSSDSFMKIIKMDVDKYVKNIYEKFGINILCDDSIYDIIYKDGVFPTQGTRPVYSTVNAILKTKLSIVIKEEFTSGNNFDKIKYSYTDGKIIADIYIGDSKIDTLSFNENLKVENLRKVEDTEQQAITAVHESGHFVMYLRLKNKYPNIIYSVSSNKKYNGYMVTDEDNVMSAKELLDKIKILLSGYVAEEVIFGKENVTNGSDADLKNATILASKYVREYLFGKSCAVSTYIRDSFFTEGGNYVNEDVQDEINKEIKNVMSKCWDEVRMTFKHNSWYKVLTKSAKYLFNNPYMTVDKMKEIYDIEKNKSNDHLYRDKLMTL